MFLPYLTYWLSVVLRLKSRLFHLAYQAICDTIPAYFPASSHPLAPYRSAMWTFLQDHKHTIVQPSSPFSLCPLNVEHNFLLSPYLLFVRATTTEPSGLSQPTFSKGKPSGQYHTPSSCAFFISPSGPPCKTGNQAWVGWGKEGAIGINRDVNGSLGVQTQLAQSYVMSPWEFMSPISLIFCSDIAYCSPPRNCNLGNLGPVLSAGRKQRDSKGIHMCTQL